MINKGDCLIIAVSGGADSISLLYALNCLKDAIGFKIKVAHLNHMLRGLEADGDAEFVKNKARKLGVDYVIDEKNVKKISIEQKLSIQEAGRMLRYIFFQEEAKKISANKIALAHTLDDQAETILMRVVRGAGIAGMSGILPVRENIIRPIIEISRNEVENFLLTFKIKWKEDPSNLKNIYLRNRIRSDLLPIIKKNYNPNIVRSLQKLGDIFREEEIFFSHYCENIFKNSVLTKEKKRLILDLNKIRNESIAIKRRLVRECIKKIKGNTRRISFDHVEEIFRMTQKKISNKYLMLPDRIIVEYDNESLIFYKNNNNPKPLNKVELKLHIPGVTLVEEFNAKFNIRVFAAKGQKHFQTILENNIACLDYHKTGNGLKIRNRLPGDRFTPLGMKGGKKLKNFFIDEKIPKDKRDLVPLVVNEKNSIIWVVGLRISEKVKIGINTEKILEIVAENL